jgi:RNA polymerase sigma factor (sigma-70 family)
MTDEEIVGHVQSGKTELFVDLVRRHQDAVFGMAMRFTGHCGDAEDIVQEIFLKAFRSFSDFTGNAKFSTWLYRVAYNLCVDSQRKNRRKSREVVSLEDAGDAADEMSSLEGALLSAEDRELVRRALEGLDEHYRSVVVLAYYQTLSYEEISAVLGIPVKTVETRLYRARKKLRDSLEQL